MPRSRIDVPRAQSRCLANQRHLLSTRGVFVNRARASARDVFVYRFADAGRDDAERHLVDWPADRASERRVNEPPDTRPDLHRATGALVPPRQTGPCLHGPTIADRTTGSRYATALFIFTARPLPPGGPGAYFCAPAYFWPKRDTRRLPRSLSGAHFPLGSPARGNGRRDVRPASRGPAQSRRRAQIARVEMAPYQRQASASFHRGVSCRRAIPPFFSPPSHESASRQVAKKPVALPGDNRWR